MAAMLRNSACRTVNKGPPSSFYTSSDKSNPVYQSLEQEIGLFVAYMRKRTAPGYVKPKDEASSRPADTLFELWTKYEPRLPTRDFQERLLQMADFLVSIKEYQLALWQCYGRYLRHFGDVNVEEITDVDLFKETFFANGFEGETAGFTFRALMGKSICTYEVVRQTDPKLQNVESVSVCLKLLSFLRLVTQVILPRESLCWLVYNGTIHMYSIARHLMSLGHCAAALEYVLWACMCMESSVPLLAVHYLTWRATLYTAVCQCYYDCKAWNQAESFARRALSKINDLSQLESKSSAKESRSTEAAFRQATVKMAIMVFRRTVFETRRKPKGLLRPKTRANLKDAATMPWPRTPSERLLSDMFEGSSSQYLCILETLNDTNRRTLLTAPPASENEVEILDVFAELFMAAQEIVAGGSTTVTEEEPTQTLPRNKTGRGTRSFSRMAKKTGVISRLGRRSNSKISIRSSSRGPDESESAHVSPVNSPTESATALQDHDEDDLSEVNGKAVKALEEGVASEVQSSQIISVEQKGGGGNQSNNLAHRTAELKVPGMAGIVPERPLIELATRAEDGVPMSVVVRLVKHAYNYEQWDTFDLLYESTMAALRELKDPRYGPAVKDLELLRAYDRVVPRSRQRKLFIPEEESENNPENPPLQAPPSQAGKSTGGMDDLLNLADVLLSIITGPYKQEELDQDMIVDATLCLWNKVKVVFQKYQTGAMDNPKYLNKMDNPGKWVFILESIHQVIGWIGLNVVDPALTAEVILRLTLVLDASSMLEMQGDPKSPKSARSTKFDYSLIEDEGSVLSAVTKEIRQRRESMNTVMTEATHDRSMGLTSRASIFSHAVLNSTPRDQLVLARDILEQGLNNVSNARLAVSRTDGKNITDVSWAKELNEAIFAPVIPVPDTVEEVVEGSMVEGPTAAVEGDATSVSNTIRDLHLELIFMYHRICLRLAALGPDPTSKAPKPFKRRTCSHIQYGSTASSLMPVAYVESYDELVTACRRSNMSRALLLLQKAFLVGTGGQATTEQKAALEEAKNLIIKAQNEERRLYMDNMEVESDGDTMPAEVPPAPLLLTRTDDTMVFKPRPFVPTSGQKVAWYRIFGRISAGSNVKVRLNDYFIEGAGDEVPAFGCELRVAGLVPGERYVFAIAAYTAEGKLIGGSIGETSKPILASHPLPFLLAWAYIAQVSYQVGHAPVAEEACQVLWNHFVATPPPPQTVTYVTSAQDDFKLTLHRLNRKVVSQVSPILLRMFLATNFIYVDLAVKGGELFCNVLCDKGPVIKGQLARLGQCERLLVALEVAGWLNEANLALQAVVQCYGLLAPMIHFKIPAIPVIQVLERCHTILQEIPANVRQRRQASLTESLHHMTACLTYHMAKVLRTWSQRTLAGTINDAGRKLLAQEVVEMKVVEPPSEKPKDHKGQPINNDDVDESIAEGNTETGSLTLAALKKKKAKKGQTMAGKDDGDTTGNEELKALEAHILRLSRQAQGEHELTGNEDPSILHAYIAYLPAKLAYKEVAKFRRRLRYLEFFVQVAQKALAEGLTEAVLDWCDETMQWLAKRNETIMGGKTTVTKQPGAYTVVGDDPKKFAAAMVEYSKDTKPGSRLPSVKGTPRRGQSVMGDNVRSDGGKAASQKGAQPVRPKKIKYKALRVDDTMTDAQKAAQEEAEIKALHTLGLYLVDLVHMSHKRKRLRKISAEEAPWRAQLNILQGLSQFGFLLNKIEFREKILGYSSNVTFNTSFLDQEWFTFETVGTLVVGWDGGPSRLVTRQDTARPAHLPVPSSNPEKGKTSGIEIAAAAATEAIPEREEEEEEPELLFGPKRKNSRGTKMSRHSNSKPAVTDLETSCSRKAPGSMFPGARDEDDTPRTHRSEAGVKASRHRHAKQAHHEDSGESALLTSSETTDMLAKTFGFFKKAIMIAHRGQHWTLLQNASRAMWNCTHTALLRTAAQGESLLQIETLRALAWQPFSLAADCLLDMLHHFQMNEKQGKKKRGEEPKQKVEPRSWMGDIHSERGGASLKFEEPLDDISVVDMRWMRRLILRVIEMLYYEQKWERLVDIALRFNAISDNRYVEQVNPLLIQAQRKLHQRIDQYKGKRAPQPHYISAMQEKGKPITAKAYVGVQLRLHLNPEDLEKVDPGAHIDPIGHSAYGSEDGLRLCSVPLDVKYSLQTLREALSKSQYTARALQHSRRLLTLYLAGQQNGTPEGLATPGPSRVEFVPNTARPQPTMPVDLSREEFLSVDDIQMSPLPKSQVSIVLNSYDKTIEMLLANNQKGLAAEAMHELGNLHYHMGNMKGTYKWWSKSLDMLLGKTDSLRKWRNAAAEDMSRHLLDTCGLWGCLMGGILTSNLAQYVLTSDLGLRTECCFLSGYFFKALFRSSLPHPTADRDYALYEVGEGCEVTNLVPGVDLLSERFRCDGRTLVAALRFVMDELARGRHDLFVLPLLTLHQYFSTFVCRDLQRAVGGRILRVSVLTDAGLFTEAFITLQRLLHGERLPHTADSHFRQMESRTNNTKFDTSKPLLDLNNLKVLESVLDKRLSSSLGNLYGPHLTCHLSIVQAHLLTALADTLPVLPQFDEITGPPGSQVYVPPQTISTISRGGGKGPQLSQTSSAKSTGYKHARLDDVSVKGESGEQNERPSSLTMAGKRLSSAGRPVTLEEVKGTLLAIADQMLSTMSEIILENAQNEKGTQAMSAAELELVIQARLEQAAIARQRHHAALAARITISALLMLQDADIFKDRKSHHILRRHSAFKNGERNGERNHDQPRSRDSPVKLVEPENSQYQYQNFASRARLDARTWILGRRSLVQSMMMELRGMGAVKGVDRKVKVELADVRLYCAEGVAEAEACGDVEALAEFFLMGVVLNMQEGIHVDHTKELLQDVLARMSKVRQLSTRGQLLRVVAMTHLTDLEAAVPSINKDADLVTEVTLPRYCQAHTLLLQQLENLGETIEHHYPEGKHPALSTPMAPLQNLYLPHLLPLVQLKLRIGHAMARNAAKTIRDCAPADQSMLWTSALGVLMTSLEMSQAMVSRVASLEAEILLTMGKVQRQLYHLGSYHHRATAATLLSAITTSYLNNHDLGLMRQAYLELALLFLSSSDSINIRDNTAERSTVASTMDMLDDESASRDSAKSKRKRKEEDLTVSVTEEESKKEPRAKSRATAVTVDDDDVEKERKAALIAIRCAAAVGQAMRARLLLTGDPSVTTQTINSQAQADLPEFAVLDLVGSYVLGEKKRIFKDDIEEELAPLMESLEPPPIEIYEDQLTKARGATQGLSWVQILGYQGILQRLSSTQTLTAMRDAEIDQDSHAGSLGPDFDLGFISHAQFDTSLNHDVVRSVIYAPGWDMRLNYLHTFITRHLPQYSKDCCAIFPPSELHLAVPKDLPPGTAPLVYKSYRENRLTTPQTTGGGTETAAPSLQVTEIPAPPPGSNTQPIKPADKPVVSPPDGELCIQWYQPSMEEYEASGGSVTGKLDRQILALYTYTKKGGAQTGNIIWVSLAQLMDLHDRLSVLIQRGEISLADAKPKKEASATESKPAKGKKQARIKALSPKVKKDEQLESLLKQSLKDAMSLFGVSQEEESLAPPPEDAPEDGGAPADKPADAKSQAAKSDTLTVPTTPMPNPHDIPFSVNKSNVQSFEKMFDPRFGGVLRDNKMLNWYLTILQ